MTGPLHRYLLSRIFPEYLIELTIMLSILYSVPMYTLAIVTLIYDFLSHCSLSHFPLQSSLMILIFTKSHLSPTEEERCPFPSRQATRKRVFLQGGRQVLGEVPSREIWLQFVNVAENKIFCAAHTYLCAQVIPIRDRRGTPNRARCDRHLTFWFNPLKFGCTYLRIWFGYGFGYGSV